MGFDLGNLLQQYLGGAATANPAQAEQDFGHVAQQAPRPALSQGVAEAFRSDQTPPFPQMLGQLFGRSDPTQRAGMLNQLLGNINPAVLTSVLGGLFGGRAPAQLTPEQASQVTPEQVQDIAAKAEQDNPGIVERMSDFYAEHPTLVKALGGVALAIALGKIAEAGRN
jgi:hypothetical protein